MSFSSISLGGMNAAMNALDGAAWRVARRAVESPADVASAGRPASPGAGAATGNLASAATPTLEDDVVSQLQAKNAFLVNLRVFQTGDEMLGALIDVKA